jgi:ElaB/YqjD/DUF883 family membrane-anchored ribosome-binding protein
MKGTELIAKSIETMTGELKAVIEHAENLLKATKKPKDSAFKLARAKFETTLKNAKSEVLDLEHDMAEKVKDAAYTTGNYVKTHPWNMAGVGAGLGLLVGVLVARK